MPLKTNPKDAQLAGEPFYDTGKPCVHGHLVKRHTINRTCVTCAMTRGRVSKREIRLHQRVNYPTLMIFKNARARAQRQKIVFELTLADISMPSLCPCCQKLFVLGAPTGRPVPQAPSLDRLIPEKGYVPGNVSVICSRCNTLKRDGSVEEFQQILDWMNTHD